VQTRAFLRLAFLVIAVLAFCLPALAQRAKPFQGEWHWAVYAKSRDELPPAYRGERLKDVPGAALYLKLKQRGNKLTGEYSASRRFLARLEEGELESIIKGKTARLELQSGFGGTVTVLLSLRGNRLYWKIVKSDGEHYFPDAVFLVRVLRRPNRN
jgi:hypothetical protein